MRFHLDTLEALRLVHMAVVADDVRRWVLAR